MFVDATPERKEPGTQRMGMKGPGLPSRGRYSRDVNPPLTAELWL